MTRLLFRFSSRFDPLLGVTTPARGHYPPVTTNGPWLRIADGPERILQGRVDCLLLKKRKEKKMAPVRR